MSTTEMSEEIQALQDEEIEVLESIYDGDPNFTALGKSQYQYKYGEDGQSRSFILDLSWGPEYPNEAPKLSLDTFYNDHILEVVKSGILKKIDAECQNYLGMSMTYSIFEWVKESLDELLEEQPEVIQEVTERVRNVQINDDDDDNSESSKPKEKKEQLSKAQKRSMWKKGGIDQSDRPRGWDWVDVIKHLSKTGGKPEES